LARDLLESELKIEAGLAVVMKAISLFDEAWHDEPPYTDKYHYARFMTHIAKNFSADIAAEVSRTAMEIFGGIGFLHEFPVERWHREALITPIWEGTSNIQALDMLEAMWKKGAHKTFLDDMEEIARSQEESELADEMLDVIKDTITRIEKKPNEAEWIAKWSLNRFARATAVLMLLDIGRALRDERFIDVAKLYYELAFLGEVKVPDRDILEDIISLRGELNNISWKARRGA